MGMLMQIQIGGENTHPDLHADADDPEADPSPHHPRIRMPPSFYPLRSPHTAASMFPFQIPTPLFFQDGKEGEEQGLKGVGCGIEPAVWRTPAVLVVISKSFHVTFNIISLYLSCFV
eukprot:TRINITY_DN7707_c0_g1_i3.p1 TRINITY_DN7707_c0_g1~~TRINITY_DN7707_c0_g1_i3.p1  ORF type:complete len:117 (+),score=0.79 TRINITY_DN7707_c0_g1_i3:224-574(+)